MMRGGSRSRPKRETRVPRHLASQELSSPPVSGSGSDSDDAGSWASEDDPDRLWCVCQQPHNNRFMICCDSCSDWYHGKCVGITKKMGKEMEEVGNEWTCPKCTEKKENEVNEKQTFQLKVKLKESQAFKNKKQPVKSPGAGSGPAMKSPGAGAANKKRVCQKYSRSNSQ